MKKNEHELTKKEVRYQKKFLNVYTNLIQNSH